MTSLQSAKNGKICKNLQGESKSCCHYVHATKYKLVVIIK